MKAYPDNDDFVILLNDRLKSIRSKLIKIGQDGTTKYSVTNTFSRPVSLELADNGNYYVTDLTGQYGTIFFRTFVQDGSGNSQGQTQGGSTGGGNAGGGIIGGSGNTGGSGNAGGGGGGGAPGA